MSNVNSKDTLRHALHWAADYMDWPAADARPLSNGTTEMALIYTNGERSGYVQISINMNRLLAAEPDDLWKEYFLPMLIALRTDLTRPSEASPEAGGANA